LTALLTEPLESLDPRIVCTELPAVTISHPNLPQIPADPEDGTTHLQVKPFSGPLRVNVCLRETQLGGNPHTQDDQGGSTAGWGKRYRTALHTG